MALQSATFVLATILFCVYAVLDGPDFGVGALYPFLGRNDGQRSVLKTGAGPVWNGNEAWLLLGCCVTFIGFPGSWSLAVRAFLPVLILLLLALALRTAAVELGRGDTPSGAFWDAAYFLGSVVPTLIAGCALGDLVRGISLDASGSYTGSYHDLANPFAVLTAVTVLVLVIVHGAAWSTIRTEGQVHNRARAVVRVAGILLIVLLAVLALVCALTMRGFAHSVVTRPAGLLSLVLLVTALALLQFSARRRLTMMTWGCSVAIVVALAGVAASGAYPHLVPSLGPSARPGLTAANAAASPSTLTVLLIVALLAMAALSAYTVWAYRRSEGKAVPTLHGAILVRRRDLPGLGRRTPQRSQ